MLHVSSLQGDCGVLIAIMCLRGKCIICAAVQKPSDQGDDEHLHDHYLLTKHCGTHTHTHTEKNIMVG